MGRAKQVFYKNDRYCGQLLDDATCKKLEMLTRLDEEHGCVEDLRHIICDLSPSEVDLVIESKSNEFVDTSNKGTLENSQTTGVAYMYFAKRLILGDSVGMGKTVEVCALCNLIESVYAKENMEFRFLMLTGKTLVDSTRRKMVEFSGNYVQSVYGEKADVEKFANINRDNMTASVVGSHSLLKSTVFQDYMRSFQEENGYNPFDILIIDESGDILTNTKTQIYNDGMFLANQFDRVILLNATSFEKSLRQFYAQLNFIDSTLLPTKTEFSKEYEIMQYGITRYPQFSGKYQNADKFRQLVGYRYLQRTRKSTGAKMENCSAEPIISDLSSEQKKLLKQVSIPTMVYDCPSYFPMAQIPTNVETTPKLRDLVDLISNRLKDESTILVYARYKEAQKCICDCLEEHGISANMMNGDTPTSVRNEYIDKFTLGDFKVLVTSVQKGLDFGDCNHCIFYDYDPNPNRMVQFEGRMTRSYDIINKHVYILLSRGKELSSFRGILADTAQASDLFAGSDFSCVLSILLEEETLKKLK